MAVLNRRSPIVGALGPKTVVFDIDGVLCDSDVYTKDYLRRAREVMGPTPEGESDWNWLGGAQEVWADYRPYECPVIESWAILLRMLYIAGYKIILITSRTDDSVEAADGTIIHKKIATESWLERGELPYDELHLWPVPHPCTYDEWKVMKIRELQEQGYQICLAIDDHEGHCNAYKAEGVPFIHAHPDSLR